MGAGRELRADVLGETRRKVGATQAAFLTVACQDTHRCIAGAGAFRGTQIEGRGTMTAEAGNILGLWSKSSERWLMLANGDVIHSVNRDIIMAHLHNARQYRGNPDELEIRSITEWAKGGVP